ncbi:tetratricopeptide repeat protein [Geotalea toluenoxydans]|uniref:tetratricopeptide repeat protein n=1 Tax=Geotalea toluenoxydans TaxID=421624 RepID=UPI0006D2CB4D|nr:tetratricopeptide repeat protein [Geotalea toluenoxydans]
MSSTEPEKLFARGLAAFKSNDTLSALVLFEKACQLDYNPGFVSYLAFCLAKERGQYKKAIALCKESVEKEPANQAHYLNLGRIHVLMGNKPDAILAFREGLSYGNCPELSDHLERLGARKKPFIPFLKRNHPINKFIGIILGKLGLR